MKKRILFITPDLRFGGTSSSLSNIFNAIKEDYDIDVFSLYNKQIGSYSFSEKVLKNSKLIYWYYCYFSDLKGLDKVGALLIKMITRLCLILKIDFSGFLQEREVRHINKRESYDLIIGFQEGSATLFASRFTGVRKMAWIHCDYAQYHKIVQRDEYSIYEKFNSIVCVSKYTCDSFVSFYPLLKEHVVTIYNLYDKVRVENLSKQDIDDSRFDNSLFTILSVGRIDSVKCFSKIPEIAEKIIKKGKEFRWYIIGNVVSQEEYDALYKGIIDKGLEKTVILLGGKSNPYPYFAKSNLFVTTSFSEACPMVFLEAQTFDIPIVTTDFASSYEFIEHGINGFISPIEDLHRYIIMVIEGRLEYKTVNLIDKNKNVSLLMEHISALTGAR